jgi:hypothetical protein
MTSADRASAAATAFALLLMASISDADPVPPWDQEDDGGPSFGVLATVELTASLEWPWSTEEQTSIVLFAGPAGLFMAPGGGAGAGVEAGAEVRDYFEGYGKGGFFSLYMGAGSAWSPDGSENLSTISAGLKAGTRIRFSSLLNGEFYFGPGGHFPLGSDLDPFISLYIGFRVNAML